MAKKKIELNKIRQSDIEKILGEEGTANVSVTIFKPRTKKPKGIYKDLTELGYVFNIIEERFEESIYKATIQYKKK